MLILVLVLFPLDPGRDLLSLSGLGGVMLSVAFLALVAARRRALHVVWSLLLILWILTLTSRVPWAIRSSLDILPAFATWTMLAMPMAIIAALGAPQLAPAQHRRRTIAWSASFVAWLSLAMIGLRYAYLSTDWDVWHPSAAYHVLRVAAWCVWAPAPFALAAVSVLGWRRADRREVHAGGV